MAASDSTRGHASVLFDMVRREGLANTRVVLAGVTPDARSPALARPRPDERPIYQYDERPSVRPSYTGRQPYYGDRRADDDGYPPVASAMPRRDPAIGCNTRTAAGCSSTVSAIRAVCRRARRKATTRPTAGADAVIPGRRGEI